MSSIQIFDVEFEVVKKSASGAGSAYVYRRGPRRAEVSAISSHPKDLLSVLNSDIALQAGETIEILAVRGIHTGTEGTSALA